MTPRERRESNLRALFNAHEMPGAIFRQAAADLRVEPLEGTRRVLARTPLRLAQLRGR